MKEAGYDSDEAISVLVSDLVNKEGEMLSKLLVWNSYNAVPKDATLRPDGRVSTSDLWIDISALFLA